MATFSRQPFQFQSVNEEDVFPRAGFWTALIKFENFLKIFIQNQTSNQALPDKLIADKVISNNTIHNWVSYQAPPLALSLNLPLDPLEALQRSMPMLLNCPP